MRLLDQHIDRSLWPIDPAEAAQYQFIWDLSPPHLRKGHAKASADSSQRKSRAGEQSAPTSPENTRQTQQQQQQGWDARRGSEDTLVGESRTSLDEKKLKET